MSPGYHCRAYPAFKHAFTTAHSFKRLNNKQHFPRLGSRNLSREAGCLPCLDFQRDQKLQGHPKSTALPSYPGWWGPLHMYGIKVLADTLLLAARAQHAGTPSWTGHTAARVQAAFWTPSFLWFEWSAADRWANGCFLCRLSGRRATNPLGQANRAFKIMMPSLPYSLGISLRFASTFHFCGQYLLLTTDFWSL